MWGFIENHNLVKGMTCEQASLSWGEPVSVDTIPGAQYTLVRWIYPGQYLHFKDGRFIEIIAR